MYQYSVDRLALGRLKADTTDDLPDDFRATRAGIIRQSMPVTPGTRLGPYEIQAALGAGGMGEVYRARDTRLDRAVAIKVLPAHLSDDADLRERLEREARAVAAGLKK